MQIVILNGGKGKRVRDISKKKPKCLINISKRPFIYHQIKLLKKRGLKNFIFCLGYKYQQISKYLNLNFDDLKKNISIEKKELGTGGALINAKKYLDDIFFITYGDSYLNINYKNIYKKFIKTKKLGLITVIKGKLVNTYTPNILIKNKKILDKKNNDKYNYIDYGLIVLNKKALLNMKRKKFSLDKIIINLIKKNEMAFIDIKKKFYEIGSLKGIRELNHKLKND